MNAISFSLILAGVILNAAGQLLLKAGTNAVGHFDFHLDNVLPIGLKLAFNPFILSGMVAYGVSLVVWIMALSRVPVSIAYPMLSIGYVINAFIAWHWFGEALSAQKLLGIGCIVLGVYVITRSA
ncbi:MULTISPECIES: SMR family transporter [Azospira]|jgi:multidrug transporter EmrE-like cation transporter|uniref:Cation/cationic drug transporter n=2 Tax=Azospira oryzae TaxID=146939 RepID=G8QGC9_AZOOP|nr:MULTISPECIES: SMR family transporter [Azospira]AEV27247.1 cation/cationic drug transporter [Azospira oryzae PS]MBP7489022.1 EamA family transporter [Azospira sp.]MDK9692446.1 SMR family transporter [Azospira sp.]RZT90117.1 EamA-like transporter family protein [Azospira oryzae]